MGETKPLTLRQREALNLIASGGVRMANAGHGAFRIEGASPSVVGKLVSLKLASWPKGPVGEQVCELTKVGLSRRAEGW